MKHVVLLVHTIQVRIMGMQITLNLKGNVLVHLILLNYVRVHDDDTTFYIDREREKKVWQ